jgi:hypothetical protein
MGRSRAVTELSTPEIVRLRPQSGDGNRECVVRASVGVSRESLGMSFGCVGDALEEPRDALVLVRGEFMGELVEFGDERCPCLGRRFFYRRCQAQNRAASVEWVGVSGDVAPSLKAMDEAGCAAGGEL